MHAAVLECFHDEGRQGLYSHALSARWCAHPPRNQIHTDECHFCTVMLTLLHPAKDGAATFRISHQEMIKGIRLGGTGKTLAYHDTLEIPIIENTADEEDLTDGMAAAMRRYPDAPAVLVRRHGVYVWGQSW